MGRRIRYVVATSLDGYIAGPNGEVDWIIMDPEIDFGSIFAQFDTALMGRKTFEEMKSSGYPMPRRKTLVFSKTLRQIDHPHVTVVAGDLAGVINGLKTRPGKDVWLFGGGSLFGSLAAERLVDTVEVAVIPIVLGGGIPLMGSPATRIPLTLTGHRVYGRTGIVSLEYAVRR